MEYSEEDMDRIVEESKTVHRIVEAANTEGMVENLEVIADAVLETANEFKEATGLSPQEVVAALSSSIVGVLTAWAIAISGGDIDE